MREKTTTHRLPVPQLPQPGKIARVVGLVEVSVFELRDVVAQAQRERDPQVLGERVGAGPEVGGFRAGARQ